MVGPVHTDALPGITMVVLENGSIGGTGTPLGKNIGCVFVWQAHQGNGIGGRIMAELEL
jgi:citrate lyase synthetase